MNERDLEDRIRVVYQNEGKLAAIRFYRNETRRPGFAAGLADSKAMVEKVCELMPIVIAPGDGPLVESMARAMHADKVRRRSWVTVPWDQLSAESHNEYEHLASAALVAFREATR